jgi:hypothetical protein
MRGDGRWSRCFGKWRVDAGDVKFLNDAEHETIAGRLAMKIDGGCHCGYLTFEAEAEPAQTRICHCTDCQRLTGSPFRVSVPARQASFRLLSGKPAVYIKTGDSGGKREHGFCPQCGAPLYSASTGEEPKSYTVRVGSIRQSELFAPTQQIWCRSTLPWLDQGLAAPKADKNA